MTYLNLLSLAINYLEFILIDYLIPSLSIISLLNILIMCLIHLIYLIKLN